MHGLQEGHRDQNRPGILHQKEKHRTGTCGAFLFLLKPIFGVALLRLHRFQAFAGGSYTTPNFLLYIVFKEECL